MTFSPLSRLQATLDKHLGRITRALRRIASGLGIQPLHAVLWSLAVALAVGGAVALLTVRYGRARDSAQRELIAIADQRVNRLVDWRRERLADGNYFSSARFAADSVMRWLADPESEAARAAVVDWLGSLQGDDRYYEVMVFDERLEHRLALPPETGDLTTMERARLVDVRQTGEVILSDLETADGSGRISCDVAFPIFGGIDRKLPPVAIGLLRANARASLFPMLRRWPVPSETAETLLVRREGEEVLYLNDLRHRGDTALSLRRSFRNGQLPAARVLQGEKMPFEGIDYRGGRVVAVGRLVPGTPWAVVAKVDQREIYGPLRWQLLAELAMLASALLAGGMVVAYLWQKRRASLLRSAAQEWERTFDSVPDLISILDHRNRVSRVNRAMAERIGRLPEGGAGANWLECMPDSVLSPEARPHVRTARDQQTHSAEVSNPRLGGDFLVTSVPLVDNRGAMTGVVHVARDITERKLAEAALRESREAALRSMAHAESARQEAERVAVALRQSEALLQKALDAPTVGVLFFRLNGRIDRANATFERMSGYDSAELARLTHWETLTAPEYWAANELAAAELAEKGATEPFEKQMVRKDGTRWWGMFAPTVLSGKGRDAECVEFVLDITERRRAEAALRESNERLKKVLEVETVGVMFWDLNTGCMTDANHTFLQMMGYSHGEVERGELTWQKLTPPEYLAVSRAEIAKFQASGRIGPYEKEYFRKDGTRQWLVFAGSTLGQNSCVEFCVDISELKRAERALRENEERLRFVAERAGVGYWHWEIAADRLEWSSMCKALFGVPESELISYERFLAAVHAGDRVRVDEAVQACLNGAGAADYDVEYRTQWRDGTVHWIHAKGSATFEGGQPIRMAGIAMDVTRRKEIEEALRRSEERFRSLTFATSPVVWVMSCDGRISSDVDNRSWLAFTGQTPEQMLGDGWLDAIHPADRAKVRAAWQRAIETVSTYAVDYRLRRRDGEYRLIQAHGVPVSGPVGNLREWVGTSSDVTERKQAEEELRRSELKYRAVFEQAAIGIGRMNLAEVRWMDVNDAFCRMLGYSSEEMRATPLPRITCPADVELDRAPLRRMAAGELASYSVEKRLIHREGYHVWARVTWSLVCDTQGRPDYGVAIIEDITERVRAADSLKASLREKEVMLKEIHHRVKNNMQVLSSLVNLQARALGAGGAEPDTGAGEGRTDDGVVFAAFADLRDRVRSMAMVHEKLYQSENLAAVDFAVYAESLLKNLWKAHRADATINLKLALEPVALTVDQAVPCGLILNELASNALKHAFRGRSEGTVTVASHASHAQIAICVSDDGVGLPSGLDWRQAHSLGLQLVQMLSRQLHASVEARPSGQGGAEFELVLDRRQPE